MRWLAALVVASVAAASALPAAQAPADPDALYRDRENLASARQAAAIWAARASSGTDFDAAWKLARACYWLGTREAATDTERRERRERLERGVAAGQQAATLEPTRPEGHFWMAANMGALAESFGLRQGIRYRGRIRDALTRVLKIDPAWEQGSADRALGWWYHKVPGLFGGSESRAEEHLRKALAYNPESTATLYFLAEVLFERDRDADARQMLRRVVDAPLDPVWAPEDRDFKRKAAERLKD